MPASPEALLRRLDVLGIRHTTHHHPAVFTVAESTALRGELPGGHCKSLFLRDRKDGLWLIVLLEHRQLVLKALADHLEAPRLSFGSPALLYSALGVAPGSVTPFALINDDERRVRVVLDREMLEMTPLNYHPLVNTATTAISPADLLKFIAASGHQPRIIDMAGLERGAVASPP